MAGNPAIYENPANWPDLYLCRDSRRQLHINKSVAKMRRHRANQGNGLIFVGHFSDKTDNVNAFCVFLSFSSFSGLLRSPATGSVD